MVEKKIMGSLYLNGLPMIPSSLCQSDTTISIGDTTPGRELQWVPDGDRLIADRCICFNVSWQQLNKQGLVFGTPVVIDRQQYMCRCLKVGKTQAADRCVCTNVSWNDLDQLGFVTGWPVRIDRKSYLCRCLHVGVDREESSEWDDLLDRTGNKDEVWHWKAQLFWGQEALDTLPSFNIIRGGKSSRRFEAVVSIVNIVYIGFRPILEPLPPPLSDLSAFAGKKIRVYGPKGKDIIGVLVSADEYDLILKDAVFQHGYYDWVAKDGKRIIANRNSVSFVQET